MDETPPGEYVYVLTAVYQANKAKTQEMDALQETLDRKLAEQTRATQEAHERLKTSETSLSEERAKREKVSARWVLPQWMRN